MAGKIKLLPEFVANQIAAGEVVNRPASVVKEMMENAVDAGASSVTVAFKEGGREMIRIVDDGCGMSVADARMAFDRHATSKIGSADDLYALQTFGFRGEALASIAAVSEVGLRTRQAADELGTQVEIAGGRFVNQEPVSSPHGSQFTVRNLFYNLPARRRFLDKSSTEARHIVSEYQRVALCNPDIAFALYDGDALLSKLPPATLKQRIIGVVGQKIARNLLEVEALTSIVSVAGYAGTPATARQSNREQFLFVNGRYFRSPYFHKAVVAAYDKLIPHNTQPSYFLYLTIDPARIDVNVHPQKTEIKFEDGAQIWQILSAAVRESLAKSGAVPPMDFDLDTSVDIPVYRSGVEYKAPSMGGNPDFNPFVERDEGDDLLEFIEHGGTPQQRLSLDVNQPRGAVLTVGGRYAVAVAEGGLRVVDMRRAREAVLYDRYSSMLDGGSSVCQQLLFPEEMAMSSDDRMLLGERLADFTAFGFDISLEGEHTAVVRGVPADFATAPQQAIYELLDALRDDTGTGEEMRRKHLASTMARLGALTRGTEDAGILLETWQACGAPAYTPGGNPVTAIITENELQSTING
jgi:DNA mismatch repair protein MutL